MSDDKKCGDRAEREMRSIRENGLPFTSVAGEPEFAPKRDVIINPPINIAAKIIEIMDSYKSRPDNFRPIKIDRLD
jgi:hypothetical protein